MFETLGHYKILEFIGAGGMGDVYRARDTRLGRTVAIKVLGERVKDDPERRERFLREARATAALSHPNIAALYEIGEDQGQLFLAFEFVPGETLQTIIGGRALNPRRAVDFAVQIAEALDDAHAQGVVHRDIKPANILITPKDKAKILDFGLATWTGGGLEREHAAHVATEFVTSPSAALGTVAYMSPEQALGEKVDHRTDIFSLGVVLFEMLTGRLPFTGATPTALGLQIVQAPAPAVSTVNRSVPKELDAIVAKALAKSLDTRYESAATLSAELRSIGAILDVRSDAAPGVGPPIAAGRRRSGDRWMAWTLLAAVIGAAGWYERTPIERMLRRTIGPAPPPLIAVLPLELADSDPSNTYFADGLTEDLISRLGQTPGLKVLGRSATRSYRGRPPAEVARELGASVVLTGSVRPGGDAVKVSLELIDPRDNTAMWAGQYTKELKDIFAVQAQVAGEVASALRVTLQPTRAREVALSRIVDQHAYELYLRGRQASAQRRLPEAIGFYEQAIAADAGLGEAFAGVAEVLHLQVASGAAADGAYQQRLSAAAKRAYEIDPDLPQANVAMGLASEPLADALKFLRRAVELDPSYAEAYHLIGDAIQDFDPARAITFYQRSLALDPQQRVIHVDLAATLSMLGRNEEARTELNTVGGSPAGVDVVAGLLAELEFRQERYAQAAAGLSAMRGLRAAPSFWELFVAALRLDGRTDDALAEATALQAKFPQDCEARALLAALRLERRDAAAAHRLADDHLAIAKSASALPSDVRCGLHAAAALQNGTDAAALLDRIVGSERMLRSFAEDVTGRSGTMWIDIRTYPWSLIARQPVVAEARERLEAAYARKRDEAKAALSGLP
jgi:non-specific serine/threonine protein kinase